MNWMLFTGTLIFGLAVYTPSFAQGAAETHKDEIELTRAVIKAQKKQIIAKNMNLTSDEEDQFWAMYQEYQDKMDTVSDRRVKLITDYADTLKSGGPSDEKAWMMLDDYLSYESARLDLRKSYVEKFRKVLPSKKATRYFQLENKLEAIINFELARQIPLVQ
jgi:Spy/CpxP family protein refolding chaperone